MLFRRLLPALVTVLLFTIPAEAQQVPAPTQRDVQALAVLQNAVAAMGGTAAVFQVADTVIVGNIQPPPGSAAQARTFKWKTSGPNFRYEFQSGTTTQVFVSGHGNPANERNGTVKALSPLIALANPPLHFPALVLTSVVTNTDYSVTSGGKTTVNGSQAIKVHIFLNTDMLSALVSAQDWYFDAVSGLPLRVEHRLPDNRRPENYVQATEDFADFRVVSGLLVPFKITSYESGSLVAVETITSVSFNNGLSSTEFDVPAGGAL